MIIKNRRFLRIVPICIAYIVVLLCFIKGVESEILVQAFTDKSFVYLIMPPFICGAALIEESIHKSIIIRMQNRKRALGFLLIQQYLFGFVYLLAWFILIALFAVLNRENLELSDFAESFIQYLICIALFLNVLACMKRMNRKIFITIPFVITYVLLLIDVLAVTSITGKLGIAICLMFSWAFYKNSILGIILLSLFCCISYLWLKKLNSYTDLY